MALVNLQIGKKGLTKEFILSLKVYFKNADSVRISVLKSATRDSTQLRNWLAEILEDLGKNYTGKIIGYTFVLRKWRKSREKK